MTTQQQYDYIIIGSGIAGLYTALLAMEHGTVLILTKGSIEDCNTQYAQGGIAAAVGPEDSPSYHLEDTLAAGAGLCNEEAARILAEEGPQAIAELVRLGVIFDTANGEVSLGREAAHRMPRVLHAGGDATGAQIELTLAALARSSRIHVQEYVTTTRLILNLDGDRVIGVAGLDSRSGTESEYFGTYTVLATGGAGRLYQYTTNPEVTTGDGVSLAYNSGAAVMDMEFYQFHPTALRLPGAPPFLITEAMRGEGAVLRNTAGATFMERYHAQGDLAPRDVVSRALLAEMHETSTDHVLLDATHLPAEQLATRFPSIYSTCLTHSLDITKDLIPVSPAAHYMMGGVLTNTEGETTLPGLYACGEVSCTGLHGANRLASNSLLETVVFGQRLVRRTREGGWSGPRPEGVVELSPRPSATVQVPVATAANFQELMWNNVGILRDSSGLEVAASTFAAWEAQLPGGTDRSTHELSNMVTLGRLIAESALLRQESRGAHYRTDFAETSAEWERHTVVTRGTPLPHTH
jgi:L-aspartate oxidase